MRTTVAVAAVSLSFTVLGSVSGCAGEPSTPPTDVGASAPSLGTSPSGPPLTTEEIFAAARTLRVRQSASGYFHDDRNCPQIGGLAPHAGKQDACFRTRTTFSPNVTNEELKQLLAPLHVTTLDQFNRCGKNRFRRYRGRMECHAFGSDQGIPVTVDLLLGYPTATATSGQDEWTRIKVAVIPSLDMVCPPPGDSCIVGDPAFPG